MPRRWTGPITIETRQTGDGRVYADGCFFWNDAEFPLPFRWDEEDDGFHAGARVIGTVEEIERRPNGIVWGAGTIDDGDELGADVVRGIDNGELGGVSVDMDDIEVTVIDTTVEETEESPEAVAAAAGDPDPGPDGGVVVFEFATDQVIERYTRARIRAVTLVDVPAFDEARITLDPVEEGEPAPEGEETATRPQEVVVASVTVRPPAEWFQDPQLAEPTPMTVTADGRIYGHAAVWGTCHIGIQNSCVTPPRSNASYAYFRTGETVTACATCEEPVPTGVITLATGHADLSLGHRAASAHYDDTGTAVADVASGEDAHGIWFAGAVRPDVMADPDRLQALRASAVSGDWRRIGGSLELVAMLAVNVPGFPVTRGLAASASVEGLRPRFRASGGEQTALVASGVVLPVDPRDRAIADLRRLVASLSARVDVIDTRTAPIIPLAHKEALAAAANGRG